MRLVLLFIVLATPLYADPCADHFRAGLRVARPLDVWLAETEATLYAGLDWVTRARVMERLEARSAVTSACQEVATLRRALHAAQDRLIAAQRSFQLASALCWDVNRARAQGNLASLDDHATALRDLAGYIASLDERCPG
ncbi:hypothetical protein [Pararhodobacter zhoushanensis]|uniref:Uncharacterized protein n=1 Tax=Pararhodobacter zhoushanensis TaxID=2479545 RepID=A0ABT3H000_9RHOB|nr:hypothetical protein [Pararhodobacter zhoushanensis]MCW1933109.1 hypothetical protein [Pararhodobacter zhoushanensis]